MSPRAIAARLLAGVVFALAMIVPFRASAAIVPACEVDVETRAPIESSCDSAGRDDHASDSVAAPMCGEQGVSAIAPPRLMPVADARIEARSACSSFEQGPSVSPQSNDPPALTGSAMLERATLDASLVVRPAPFLDIIALPAPIGGRPLAGFGDDVYHPPR